MGLIIRQKPYPNLKPNENETKNKYYTDVTWTSPQGQNYLKNYQHFDSSYTSNTNNIGPQKFLEHAKTVNYLRNF